MANIDSAFRVEILSLNDETLIATGSNDPTTLSGYGGPVGSLFLRHQGTSSRLYVKTNTNDVDWSLVPTSTSANAQPLDATLTSLAAFNTNGLLTQTAADTFTGRTITAGSSKIAVTNGNGVSGNPTVDFGTVTLDDLSDVVITVPLLGQVLKYNGTNWINDTDAAGLGTVTSVAASQPAAGLTISGSPITTAGTLTFALANDLAALEGLSSTGIAVRSATDTWVQRTIASANTKITVTDGNGVAGNPTLTINEANFTGIPESAVTNLVSDLAGKQPLDATLTSLAAFNTNGLLTQTAADTFTGRTITGTASRISVTNGDGVSGNPTIDIDAAYVGQTSITTLGTVTTGTWSATTIATTRGGTGLTAIGTANQVIGVNSGASALEYKTVTAGTNISVVHGAGTITINSTAQAALQLYAENPSSPTAPSATGTNAVAIGSGVVAAANNSLATGFQSRTRFVGSTSTASGNFSAAGDAQTIWCTMRNTTTNSTPVELFVDGSSARLVMQNNSCWFYDIMVVARRIDATGGNAAYRLSGCITRDATAATTAQIGGRTKVIEGEADGAWDAEVTADTTNGSLAITVTGQNAKTIRWVASVRIAEVLN